MKVRSLMSREVLTVDENTGLREVAALMSDAGVGVVPVCRGEKLVGLITDRDIVIRALADTGDLTDVKAKEIMSTDIKGIDPSAEVRAAASMMAEHQIRRLPVMVKGDVVGMLSLSDVALADMYSDEAEEALQEISTPASIHNRNYEEH